LAKVVESLCSKRIDVGRQTAAKRLPIHYPRTTWRTHWYRIRHEGKKEKHLKCSSVTEGVLTRPMLHDESKLDDIALVIVSMNFTAYLHSEFWRLLCVYKHEELTAMKIAKAIGHVSHVRYRTVEARLNCPTLTAKAQLSNHHTYGK